MLQRRFPFTEILYAILFINQTLFPEKFTFLSSLLYFLTVVALNWYIDGFRTITFIIFIIQTLFLLTSSTYIHILLVAWMFWAVWFFPVYKSPKPTGKYLVGYKFRSITGPKGATSMGVYYPTTEQTKDVKYAPTEASWSRFADFMKFFAESENNRPLAKPAVRVAMNLFERQYLGVNEEAPIVKAESQEGFPVVVFSHGLSANIHIYASLLKEWASHGFIVLSMDHDELIYMPKAEYGKWEDHLKARSVQLEVRKKTVIKVLDLVHDSAYIQNLFGDNGIKVNSSKVFLAGHSFGGGTVSEVAALDKRATGALLLLDPWMEACDEKVLTKSVSIPILSLRSHAFDRRPRIKTPVVKHIEANKKNILSGYFKGSGHNSMLDLVLYMPRDMAMSREIKVQDVGEQMRSHLMLSRIFLQTALEQGGKTSQGENVMDLTLKKFRKVINMVGQPDTLIVDP